MFRIVNKTKIYFRLLKKKEFFFILREVLRILKTKSANYYHRITLIFMENIRKDDYFSIVEIQDSKSQKLEIPLLVATFFDHYGNDMFFGGAERYILELHRLLRKMGYNLVVYQCANSNWVRYYGNVKVIGLNTGGYNLNLLNRFFHKWIPESILTIYFQMNLATPYCNAPSICVSHGIDWDTPWLQDNKNNYHKFVKMVLSSINNVNHMVSVDTNTINWVRAGAYNLSSKCSYIPNFVDCDQFKPEITRKSENRLVILYPRRLYEARGFWLVEKIIPGLLEKYPCLEFHFCGKANRLEEVEVKALINNYPENVKWYFYPPEEMHQAYPKADIVVIPTLYSEGTSLSCLEALACRKAVIATNVGGLPNLIIPDFNGLLIEPDVDSLREALELLINNEELRNKIAENGYKTASAFNIKTWGLRWRNLFKNYLPGLPPRN